MQFEGNEAAAMAAETYQEDTVSEVETNEVNDAGSGGFFSTPAPELAKPKAHKHRGYIKSATTLLSKEKGTGGIEFVAQSESNGQEYKRTIWVLDQYRDNPNLDPDSLKDLPAPEGKKQTPRERYARTIQNSKGSGELQTFITCGTAVGRTFGRYTTFEQLGEVLAQALIGTPIVFKDRAEETETGYRIGLGDVFPLTDSKGRDMFDVLKVDAADGN